MSNPMNNHQAKPGPNSGYSLIELVIASTLLALMIGTVATLSVSGAQALEYSRRLNRVTQITQQTIDDLRLEIVSSVRIFSNGTEGNGNLALLDLAGAPVPLSGLRLPTVSANETIRADTAGNEITGNSLFFAKFAWSDRFVCTSTNEYLVDVYRWVYYYLSPEEGGPDPSHSIGLNIVRVVSEPLIAAGSIDRITDPIDQAEVLMHLFNSTANADGDTHDKAEVVWVRGGLPSVTGTFRHTDENDGSLSDDPLVPRPTPWNVLRRDSIVTGLLSYRHHSVASIYSRDSFGVTRYAIESTTGAGFPHGLEIQVVGPSAARQVLIHMVNSSTQRSGHLAWSRMQLSVDARDL
jgi:Tfp pilus assembly protein PilV